MGQYPAVDAIVSDALAVLRALKSGEVARIELPDNLHARGLARSRLVSHCHNFFGAGNFVLTTARDPGIAEITYNQGILGEVMIDWKDSEVQQAIREFCATEENNGNAAIGAVLLRRFHIDLNENKVAGIVWRMGIKRGGRPKPARKADLSTRITADEALLAAERAAEKRAVEKQRSAERRQQRDADRAAGVQRRPTDDRLKTPVPEAPKVGGYGRIAEVMARGDVPRAGGGHTEGMNEFEAARKRSQPQAPITALPPHPVIQPVRSGPIAPPRTCQWPSGGDRGFGSISFECEDPVHPSRPYCLGHCRVSYQHFNEHRGPVVNPNWIPGDDTRRAVNGIARQRLAESFRSTN